MVGSKMRVGDFVEYFSNILFDSLFLTDLVYIKHALFLSRKGRAFGILIAKIDGFGVPEIKFNESNLLTLFEAKSKVESLQGLIRDF